MDQREKRFPVRISFLSQGHYFVTVKQNGDYEYIDYARNLQEVNRSWEKFDEKQLALSECVLNKG